MAIGQRDIEEAVRISRLPGYTGRFKPLGGGEVNDTFLLECGNEKHILRITRRPGRDTLLKEAEALKLLNSSQIPRLVFFDPQYLIDGRFWIIESYLEGSVKKRLEEGEFRQLGQLLAKVHSIKDPAANRLDVWQHFLVSCRSFGDELSLLSHEDAALRQLIHRGKQHMINEQPRFEALHTTLIHGDATPSNILVNNGSPNLIDWEFSRFSDPMLEFSTIYYEDMEFNKGKWRVHIEPGEKQALFAGYTEAGGVLDESRIAFWMNIDKLGAAVFLYWRVNYSNEETSDERLAQYKYDLENLTRSLKNQL